MPQSKRTSQTDTAAEEVADTATPAPQSDANEHEHNGVSHSHKHDGEHDHDDSRPTAAAPQAAEPVFTVEDFMIRASEFFPDINQPRASIAGALVDEPADAEFQVGDVRARIEAWQKGE